MGKGKKQFFFVKTQYCNLKTSIMILSRQHVYKIVNSDGRFLDIYTKLKKEVL